MTDGKCGKLNIITGPMFSGKCLRKGTKIIMYDGHLKNVEDIIINDQLMGDDSKPRTVLSTTCGVGPLYKVSPIHGDPYVVNDQHILSLKCDDPSFFDEKNGKFPEKDSKEAIIDIPIKDFINKSNDFRSHYKGYRVGIEFPHQSVPLDPYIVGVGLGNSISREMDYEVSHHCDEFDEKHEQKIHHSYLMNSEVNRLQLLAGLLDACGFLDHNKHSYEIKIAQNELFVNQIMFLIRSLGMISKVHQTTENYVYEGVKHIETYHIIQISGSRLHEIPCRFDHKRVSFHANKNDLLVDISIQPDGQGEYCGFTLDGNGRFLLSDFTVTHNSSELQRQVRRLELAGKKCLIIKHASDVRYGKEAVCCTHDRMTMPALPVKCLWDIKDKCNEYDVISIDECQFYPEITEFVEELVEKMHKVVILAALDGTYEGKPFGRVAELLPLSDQFIKLNAVCRDCGNDAPFTIRRMDFTDKKDVVEVVGGADLYESVCRQCRSRRNEIINKTSSI